MREPSDDSALTCLRHSYLVEGIMSFLAAPMVYFILPDTLDKVSTALFARLAHLGEELVS